MTTAEENQWEEAVTAYDDGKGIPLEEINPDDGEAMNNIYAALNVHDFEPMKKFHLTSLAAEGNNTDTCIVSSNNRPV